ncbi:MAG: L-erythro-3,5-diaminohexanoate dehydrogenase [Clostridiaceae bacterium]|jgi:L-erythro-3,5-diaminohexanoate dehydrogenase|nr:L-erythro-3,5-diaminohexanoate dehydrogenase [Clostridiaceae bacterium]
MAMGNKYGSHRVIEPQGLLPQAAQKIDNKMEIYDNEILIDVTALNIDSASFHQLWDEAKADEAALKAKILEIVNERGKMQNPVTGSGGMLMGSIAAIGPALSDRDLAVGDRIATLVSLSLTPLKIEEITAVHPEIERVEIKGQAILFESGIYAKLPDDISENLALAALDVCGAPAQTAHIVQANDSVLILGAGGKSGQLCAYEAMRRVGPCGKVVGMSRSDRPRNTLIDNKLVHEFFVADARNPVEVMDKALACNDGKEYDVCINVVNIEGSEMSSILPVREGGLVYFFSMATSFTRAALGAEGIGKDLTMIVGNGYSKNHAEITLDILRRSDALRRIFEENYL